MYEVYYCDGVQATKYITFDKLEDAINWVHDYIYHSNLQMADNCTSEELASSKVAHFEIFNGSPITYDSDGSVINLEPVSTSKNFYVD